jgi:DNA-binding response OmpR family regulator
METHRYHEEDLEDYNLFQARRMMKLYPMLCLRPIRPMMAALRTVKDEQEIACFRKAVDINREGLEEVLRRLKKEKDTPVILLTARDAVMDKVSGLDAGAVDYVTKPFAIEELLARIRVALKLHSHQGQGAAAAQASVEGQLAWGPLLMDIPRHRVTMNGHEIALTNREFLMLQTLLENTDIVLSRDTLLERVCGYEYAGETNVIDVYIRYLRSKIDDVFSVQMIRTVRGVGYVINKWEDSGESRL